MHKLIFHSTNNFLKLFIFFLFLLCRCTESILSIVALYSIEQDIFSNTLYNKSSKKDIKEQYHKTSDHLAISMLCSEWQKKLNESDFTNDNFCNDMNISPLRLKLYDSKCLCH